MCNNNIAVYRYKNALPILFSMTLLTKMLLDDQNVETYLIVSVSTFSI